MLFLNAALVIACSYRLFLAFQQSGYKKLMLFSYNTVFFQLGLISAVLSVVAASVDIILLNKYVFYTTGAVIMFIAVIFIYLTYKNNYKKPLVFTRRAVRLIIVFCLLIIAYHLLYFTDIRCMVWAAYLFAPLLIKLSYFILYPFEKLNNIRYIKKATLKLRQSDAIKIGITGSYGKTSVKNILYHILSRKYNALMTPQSFNTPLGIARAVDDLKPETQIFIAEMGARRKKDIKELSEIIRPEIGIITGINCQHLETFKSVDNISRTKFDLISALSGRKLAVINADNQIVLKYAEERGINAIKVGSSDADLIISDVKSDALGSSFGVVYKDNRIELKTRLLGAHNAINISLAIAVAVELDVPVKDIKAAVFDLAPVPHRQELIKGMRGITIIDDTYNSNPDGARSALETLKSFPGRKVVLTPGLVELGKSGADENRKLGNLIKQIADTVILIKSDWIEYISEGLWGYDGTIRIYNSLKDATADFHKLLNDHDTLLLLNDLPDSMGG
ncbi:MAG: UDP-N-acetylmuramoyl-tripeptide--D-alanyl-D-alanine ligase [Christensenellales bacterium]|jgi:UDP-N-acetylmuramoyl-tripeptide--D-alanyl-D-alanine ligase